MDNNYSNKIFFSDEEHFTLGGDVNKKNCRIWRSESPQENSREAITSRKSVCLLSSLVRSCDWTLLLRKRRWNDCHRQFDALWPYDNRLFLPTVIEYDWENMWFQQDSTTCHTNRRRNTFRILFWGLVWGSNPRLRRLQGHYIQKQSLFAELFGPKLWLVLTSSKTTVERLSPSIRSVTITDLFSLLLKYTTWRIFGFNKIVQDATQCERI